MKIDHLVLYEKAEELKSMKDYVDTRIKFHKEAARLSVESGGETSLEAMIHLRICIELYDINQNIYSRFLKISKQLNLNHDN
jgi:hypothetical protein